MGTEFWDSVAIEFFWDNAGPTPPRCGKPVPTKTSPGAAADDRDGDPSA